MNWKIKLPGEHFLQCNVEGLKEAVTQFSKKENVPEHGYLIVQKKGTAEFRLVIQNGIIEHNGEVLFDSTQVPVESEISEEYRNGESSSAYLIDDAGPEYPFTARLLMTIAVISLVASLIYAAVLASNGSAAVSILVLAAGFTQMAVFSALGQVLVYLSRITHRIEPLRS